MKDMTDREAFMLVALFLLLFAMGFAIGELRDIEAQLEHIDGHYRAAEPTPAGREG